MAERVKIGDRIASNADTLAYHCGDKFGHVEELDGIAVMCRMERSRRLVPFGADQFQVVREAAAPPPSSRE